LKALHLHSHWTAVPGGAGADAGGGGFGGGVLLTYETLTMDTAFGFRDQPVCFLSGLFRGRTNYIDTAYNDGTIWIERVVVERPPDDNNSNHGNDVVVGPPQWNVYQRVLVESEL
jgi:hypothetical protein